MKINVSECFYSIQGEGVSMGIPAVFLRLGGCNLLCKSKSWTCDTIEVWRKSIATEFEDVIRLDWIKRLRNGAHLVITGGEPMLHQEKIIAYLQWFHNKYSFTPFVEIETNGTIMPVPHMHLLVNQWNCSPKLSSSGETLERRYKDIALHQLNEMGAWFKFVVLTDSDVLEIIQDYSHLKNIILMPGGDTQKLLIKTRLFAAQKCIDLGWRYSDRLHVVIWNKKTGV